MSSSSIEVMSGNEVDMVLMASNSKGEPESKPDLHPLAAADPTESYMIAEPQEKQGEEEEMEVDGDFEGLNPLEPPPGSIIFSPQDMMVNSRLKRGRGGRGRGRGRGIRRPDALTIKLEEGVDYSKVDVPVACELCGKIFANGKTLVQHMSIHSDVKPYECPHCPKSFIRMVHLQGHLVLHGIEKQFECPVCHQRFSRQDCVKVHMRIHDKSKCVFCNVCHKAFLTLGALNIHMRIHRGEKPFKCHLCGKCFTQKNHVITHIKRHTKVSSTPFSKKLGPRMFQCEHCPRSFIRLSDYERHVQWNHGAVADANSLSEKVPSYENYMVDSKVGTMSTRPLASGDPAFNTRVKKKSFRKVMCTTGTQTDQEGGHVIIPRQYQTSASMITTSTQVSAPPTPRPADEDMYENDIFDEGMDRNFSSDEDEEYQEGDSKQERPTYQESETTMSYFPEGVTPSSNDDAFDAVLGKTKLEQVKNDEKMNISTNCEGNDEKEPSSNGESPCEEDITDDHEIHSELASEYAKRDKTLLSKEYEIIESPEPKEQPEIQEPNKELENLEKEKSETVVNIDNEKPEQLSVTAMAPPKAPVQRPVVTSSNTQPSQKSQYGFGGQRPPRIMENFNTKNWKGFRANTRGRGRGRGKVKSLMGLTGATHLRLVRKSMINFITEKIEQFNSPENVATDKGQDQFENAESSADKRVKRQAKSKHHDDDFVCSVKSCETCNPVIEKPKETKTDSPKPPPAPVQEATEKEPQTSTSAPSVKDQSQKLLQFLISGDESTLQGTDFKLISDVKESHFDIRKFKPDEAGSSEYEESKLIKGGYPIDTGSLKQDKEFFTPVSGSSDNVSPPVELQAFCIPTYSCKLCGREFRFEGKLHRHIESVHQHKAIYSPDVKPGRGSRDNERDYSYIVRESSPTIQPLPAPTPTPVQQEVKVVKKSIPKNPEIEALRLEWDDDDDDDDNEENEDGNDNGNGSEEENNTQYEEERVVVSRSMNVINNQYSINRNQINSNQIITRSIVPIQDSVVDSYAEGVKVNINKISGLAGPDSFELSKKKYGVSSSITDSRLKEQEKAVVTLDTKCRKLLEKLFDHTLLIECGLFTEHVSVVLGKILQHYGVKMIEDYGQGQYEVLKYNLWRLIEWKVTMEQMEEFYTDGKSVEEMMDDIMNGRVPIIAHHEPEQVQERIEPQQEPENNQMQTVEAIQLDNNQLMLSQVANVLNGQINLGEGVTQVVLAQDVSPEMLQGAHIVTIDPATGQVLSQVTAEQVILTETLTDDINQQMQTVDSQVVSSSPAVVSNLPPGSIVANPHSVQQVVTTAIDSDHVVNTTGTIIKLEAPSNTTQSHQ